MRDVLSEIHSEYLELVPFAPKDILDRVGNLIAPIEVETLRTGLTAGQAVEIWLAALDKPANKDSFAWIFVLTLLRKVLNFDHPLNPAISRELQRHTTLGGKPLSISGTWFEVTRRLAANLYHLGRLGQPTPEKQKILHAAISLLDRLIQTDVKISKPNIGRMYFGMRGVARLLLARTEQAPQLSYIAACKDLEQARSLGNSGMEASHYLVACKLHLYEFDESEKHLSDAEQVLNETKYRASANQLLWFDVGEVYLRRGFAAAAAGQHTIAFNSFGTALLAYQQAGFCEADPRLDSEFLQVKRGHAALKAYTCRHELGLSDDAALLDAAIHDLRSGGDSLPAALLLRSIRLRKERRYIEAGKDLEEALEATSKPSLFADENRWRCIAGLAECTIQIGIEQNDVNAVFTACEQSLTVPTTMREMNIAAMVYGARFLLDNSLAQYSEIARRIAYNIRTVLQSMTIHWSPTGSRRVTHQAC